MAQPHSGHTLPPSFPGGPSDRPDSGRPTSGLSSLLQGATHCQALSSLGFLALSLPHLPSVCTSLRLSPAFSGDPVLNLHLTISFFLFFFPFFLFYNDLHLIYYFSRW